MNVKSQGQSLAVKLGKALTLGLAPSPVGWAGPQGKVLLHED